MAKHGHTRKGPNGPIVSPTYKTWQSMKYRCQAKKGYADRGITYDPRWEDFAVFLADMGERPDGLTLDRIDNDGDYGPDNCRWATRSQQQRNKRPVTDEFRQRMSVITRGRKMSLEARKKMSLAMMGNQNGRKHVKI